jgi:hypothetical protein
MDRTAPPTLTRRDALALTAAGLSLPLASQASQASQASAVAPRSVTRASFDPTDPQQNLDLFVKLQYSRVKEPVHSYFGGLMFAQEGDLPLRLLFAYDGYGQGWADPQPDGSYKVAWKEIGLLKDPETGTYLDVWRNPLTNEDVRVKHIGNPAANSHMKAYGQEMSASFTTGNVDMPPKNFRRPNDPTLANAFVLPWQTMGAYTSVWNDARLAMNHTLDPKVWVRESSGERISITEFFQLVARNDELFDPHRNSAMYTGSWVRIASWHPWMYMGQRPGKLVYRATTQRLNGPEELPEPFLAEIRRRSPEYLVTPETWGPRFSTWKDFFTKNKPLPVGAKPPL